MEGDKYDEKNEKGEEDQRWLGAMFHAKCLESGRHQGMTVGGDAACALAVAARRAEGHNGRAVSLTHLCFPSETRCTTSEATSNPKEQATDLQGKILH